MKRIIETILMLLGSVFIIQLAAMGWFYVADPLGMFGAAKESVRTETRAAEIGEVKTEVDQGGAVTAEPSQEQAEAAAAAGSTIPTFTSAQLTCFEGVFGKARVQEIKNGAVPTAIELYQGKSCL